MENYIYTKRTSFEKYEGKRQQMEYVSIIL